MKNKLVLSLGSNLGNRYAYLLQAKSALEADFGTSGDMGEVYSTPPWGDTEQPSFLNTALVLDTDLVPKQILEAVERIEYDMGKRKLRKWGPRCIDIDILFLGSDILEVGDLVIPHQYAHERAFVLAPCRDIIPRFIHPVLGKTISDLLKEIKDDTTRF